MGAQINKTRVFGDKTEINDTRLIRCPKCKVYAVPRGITTTSKNKPSTKKHCPNCGHIHGAKSV